MILFAVRKRYGIDKDMIVQMRFVKVGGDQYLEALTEADFRKLFPDFVCLFRGHFSRLKRLDKVIALHTAGLFPLAFGVHHLTQCGFRAFAIQHRG